MAKYKVIMNGSVIGEVSQVSEANDLAHRIAPRLVAHTGDRIKYTVIDERGGLVGGGDIIS